MRRGAWSVLGALAVLVSACSFSFSAGGSDSPEEISETAVGVVATLNDEGGLGISQTSCDLPVDNEAGTSFDCVSVTERGEAITWVADIGEDSVDVNSTNLVTAPGLATLLDAVAELVAEDTALAYTAADLDCGTAPVVLDATKEITCALTLPAGDTQVLIVTVTDTQSGDFTLRAAE